MKTFLSLKFSLTGLILICMLAFSALSQDIPGAKDHPMFNRIKGFYITEYIVEDFAAEEFFDEKGADIKIEGKRTYIRYECDCEEAPLKIIRNYANAAKLIGGKSFEYSDNSVYINIKQGSMETWANVWASPEVYVVTIIEKGEVEQEITANLILKDLNEKGIAILYILFDSGKSTIKAESFPIINQIILMMREHPEIKLSIEGHTDSDGSNADNQVLSEQRAQAVMNAVIKGGIDKSRLSARGFGEENPIADNLTPEGKAKNRRVELIKK